MYFDKYMNVFAGVLQMKELLNTYYPIEIDASRSAEEKLPHMVEWWETTTTILEF